MKNKLFNLVRCLFLGAFGLGLVIVLIVDVVEHAQHLPSLGHLALAGAIGLGLGLWHYLAHRRGYVSYTYGDNTRLDLYHDGTRIHWDATGARILDFEAGSALEPVPVRSR